MEEKKTPVGEAVVDAEALKEENEQLKQALQLERENSKALQDVIVRLSAKLTGVIQ